MGRVTSPPPQEPIPIGPWSGVNNVDSQRAPAFQPGGERLPALRDALNVDIDRNGFVSRRDGYTQRLALTDGHSGASMGGMLLLVDDGTLYRVDPHDYSRVALATGLGRNEVCYVEAGGEVFWANGSERGRISRQQGAFWGLQACDPPTLSLTSGGLRAGRYGVCTTGKVGLLDMEAGFAGASWIDVPDGSGIVVSPLGLDPHALFVSVYATDANGKDLFWVKDVPVGAPIVVDLVGVSYTAPETEGCYPPPAGNLIAEYAGRILVAKGDTLYWSEPQEPHLFKLGVNAQLFEGPIVLLAPVADGFYLAVEDGVTYFFAGRDPDEWVGRQVSRVPVAYGRPEYVEASSYPWLESAGLVPSWVSAQGPAFGLPGGSIRYPTARTVAVDTHAKASLAHREQGGMRQLLMSLKDKRATSGFAMGDRAVATVIKADGTIQ